MQQGHKTIPFLSALAFLAAAAIGGSSLSVAQEEVGDIAEPQPAAGMSQFYIGSTPVKVGSFEGELVDLECDLARSEEVAKQCKREGHRHALSMQDGSIIRPLLAPTEEILQQLNAADMHGEKVRIQGRYYPTTGVILVNSVAPLAGAG